MNTEVKGMVVLLRDVKGLGKVNIQHLTVLVWTVSVYASHEILWHILNQKLRNRSATKVEESFLLFVLISSEFSGMCWD